MSRLIGGDIAFPDELDTSHPAWTSSQFRVANVIGASLAVALAGTILVASQAYAFRVRGLPGPGFFPVIIGTGLLVMSLWWLIAALLGRYTVDDEVEPPPDRVALLKAIGGLVVVGASAFGMNPLGYPLTMTIAVVLLALLGGARLRAALPTGIGFAALSFLLVTTTLGVQLPTGVLRPLLVGLL